jgi:uncharacterized membrane-anchored protein
MSTPGHTNNPNGRPKGSVNRKTQELFDTCDRLGIDPFEGLLLFAKGDYEALGYEKMTMKGTGEYASWELTISPELRAKCLEKACEYLYAKKKSVAVEVDDETKKGLTLAYANPKQS